MLIILGVISLSSIWSNALGTLGVITAFGQWLLPFSPQTTDRKSDTQPHTSKPISRSEDEQEFIRQQVESVLEKSSKKGVIIVFMMDHNVADELTLIPHVSWVHFLQMKGQLNKIRTEVVKRYKVNTEYVCAAVFDELEPDDYILWVNPRHSVPVSVFSNEATAINEQ